MQIGYEMVSNAQVHQLSDCPFEGGIDFLLKSVLSKNPVQCPRPGL